MISQVASIDETLLTPKTFVRSLSSVKSHVDFKVVSRSNTFSTVRAGERLFSGVSSHVLFKGFLTCITLSTLHIDGLRHETSGLCEKTNSIYIVFLPLVHNHVQVI